MGMKVIFALLALAAVSSSSPILEKSDETRIVGGSKSSIIMRPYQISMRYRSLTSPNNAFRHSCGGSIYDKNFIITAAHCSISRIASQLKIVAGTSYSSGTSGVISPVREIIYHQDYDPESTENDIAILVLETPLPINNFTIKPIELTDREYPAGTDAVISGWGTERSGGTVQYQLMDVTVPLVSTDVCRTTYSVIESNITESMICAGIYPAGGKDTCQGDSGGPLVADDKLVGVVSWGYGCAFPYFPGVYSNINYLRPWILDTIADAKKRYNFT